MACDDPDNDVETIVYRPRSYVECSSSDNEFTFDNLSTIDSRRSSIGIGKTSPRPIRTGLTEIKNNVINFVGSPLGRRRSKTTTQRQNNEHKVINRTASLDTLGERKYPHVHHKQYKSMEENLITGFSELASKTIPSNSSIYDHDNTNGTTMAMAVKDRSYSCPTCPSTYLTVNQPTCRGERNFTGNSWISEERRESDGDECTKNRESDGGRCAKNITVSPDNETNDVSLSVFAINPPYLHNIDIIENNYTPTMVRRPRSFVDIFKQENEQEFLFEKLACSSKSSTVMTASQNDVSLEKRSSTFSHILIKTTTGTKGEQVNNGDKLDSSPRARAKSMIIYSKENRASEPNNNINKKCDKSDTPQFNDNKTFTRTLHALTSPRSLKRFFKKRLRIPSEFRTEEQHTSVTKKEIDDTDARKCVHIESAV